MTENELNVRNFFARLAAEPTDDNEFVRRENLLVAEANITETHILKRAKPHQPGQPCIVHYLRSTQKCNKYSETAACTNPACDYWLANVKYFEKLKQMENECR